MTDMEMAMVAQVAEQASRKAVAIVLDKIKAEIKTLTHGVEPELIWNVDALQIIDRHRKLCQK